MKHFLSVMLTVLLWNNSSIGQTFIDVSVDAGFSVLSQSEGWGNGVSFFDVDEDGWDDITVCVAGGPTRFYKNQNGTLELHTVFFNDSETKSCIWVDLDEDGDNDLFITRFNAPHQVFKNIGDLLFEDVSSSYSNLFFGGQYAWGASFGDFNRDGYLDLSIASYGLEGMPDLLATGTGTGLFQTLELPPVTSNSKTSFQPVWIDLNNDLLQDLYVINDHNQGNDYYAQTSLGVFEDRSIQSGLNSLCSAMSNSWSDFDRDGDFDVYITNTIQGNKLLVNNGSEIFTDQSVYEGVELNAWSWSALWIDAENDGWDDLYIASKDLVNTFPSNNFYFKNNAGSFQQVATDGLSSQPYGGYSSAKGDLNNDGKSDAVLLTELNAKYQLFRNETNTTNNFLKFRLAGRLSNRNGIGTFYEYWIANQRRIGYTYGGEGYLTQNSQNIILGLGDAAQVDSIHLHWLSGVVDHYYYLASNSFYLFSEGETKATITSSKPHLCPNGDSLVLSIADWPVVLWDNGSANFSRVITAPGNYSAQVSTGYGHFLTLSITIAFAEIPSVITTVQNPSCFNFNDGYIQAQWSTDALTNSFQLSNLVAGNYNVPVAYGEGCSNMLPVELLNPEPLSVECAVTDVLCYGESSGSISFAMSGGTQPYNFGNSLVNGLFNLSANDYSGMLTDANGCEVFWNATINEPIPLSLSANTEMPSDLNMGGIFLNIIGGVQPYSFDWSNGIQTAENINLQAGDYTVVVTDNNGCVVDSSFSLIFNFVQPLKLNTMNWILQKDGLHYDGSETLHHVFVYDAVGRLLHREQIMAGHTTIPMNASGPVFILSHEGNWKSSISLE